MNHNDTDKQTKSRDMHFALDHYWRDLCNLLDVPTCQNVRALKQDNSSCTGEMLCLLFVPFYALYWWYTRGNDVKSLLDARDYHISSTGTLYLVLSIFGLGIVAMAIMQNDFNALSFADSVTQSNQRGAKKTVLYVP